MAMAPFSPVQDNKFVVRRVITAVYYFHRLPKAFSGGVLRIYPLAGSKNSTAFVDIEPTNDAWCFSRRGFHMRFFRWLAPGAGSKIRALQ
jgi:hypothetical protein